MNANLRLVLVGSLLGSALACTSTTTTPTPPSEPPKVEPTPEPAKAWSRADVLGERKTEVPWEGPELSEGGHTLYNDATNSQVGIVYSWEDNTSPYNNELWTTSAWSSLAGTTRMRVESAGALYADIDDLVTDLNNNVVGTNEATRFMKFDYNYQSLPSQTIINAIPASPAGAVVFEIRVGAPSGGFSGATLAGYIFREVDSGVTYDHWVMDPDYTSPDSSHHVWLEKLTSCSLPGDACTELKDFLQLARDTAVGPPDTSSNWTYVQHQYTWQSFDGSAVTVPAPE